MSYLKYSINYKWHTSCVLGKGAFGIVYEGVHKCTGEEVAVKEFLYTASQKLKMREFKVLKQLSHENIVKMVALEYELSSDKEVLIMEICRGGSLQTILEDPQNVYGLEEKEFLCVLKDLTSGVKYLRENNIVHRDLKPANILKFICEDRGSIYKLSDFGAARFLEDDQQFMSYYGTEEYLEPDLYRTAILKQPQKKSFGATVDLWSIAITLYQVATGCIPFRPFEGRCSKDTMYHLISEKPQGVISGVENANGAIDWSKELPESCLLSQGMKNLIVVLLACLLERKIQNMWTFDNFFDFVMKLLCRKVFHVFYMNEGKEFSLYMEPHRKLQDLTDGIYIETKVPPSSQLLLFESSPLLSQIDHSCCVSTMPKTSVDQPIILVHIENSGVTDLKQIHVTFPDLPPTVSNMKDFVSLAQKLCSTAYTVKRLIIKSLRCRQLLLQIPKILISLSVENVTKLCSVSDVLKLKLDAVRNHCELFEKTSTLVSQFSSIWPNVTGHENFENIRTIVTETKDQVEKEVIQLLSSISALKQRVLISKCLQNEWEKKSSECLNLIQCVERADVQVEKMRSSLQLFNKAKTSKVIHQGCVLESLKMQNIGRKLSALQAECWNACLQTLNKLYEWYHCMQIVIVQCQCLEEALDSATNNLKNFSSYLHETEFEIFQCANKFTSSMTPPAVCREQNLLNLNASSLSQVCIRNETMERSVKQQEEILLKLEIFKKSHQDLQNITEENKSLIESFDRLVQNMRVDCNVLNPLQPVPALSSSHYTLHS